MVCNIECTDDGDVTQQITAREKKSQPRERRASGGDAKTRPRAVFHDGTLVIENSSEAKIRKRRAMVRWIKDAIDLYFMTPCMAIFLVVTIGLAAYHTARRNWVFRSQALSPTDSALVRLEDMVMTLMFVLVVLLLFSAYMFFWSVGAKFLTRRAKEGRKSCCCC